MDTASLGIVERFGNFTTVLSPGLNCILWPIDSIVGRVSGRVQQFACDCGTKTKDNVRKRLDHHDGGRGMGPANERSMRDPNHLPTRLSPLYVCASIQVFVFVQVVIQYQVRGDSLRGRGRQHTSHPRSPHALAQVITEKAWEAFYKLTDPVLQIKSYVEDIVVSGRKDFRMSLPPPAAFQLETDLSTRACTQRSTVPRMELDAAFEAKEDLAHSIRDSLQQVRARGVPCR